MARGILLVELWIRSFSPPTRHRIRALKLVFREFRHKWIVDSIQLNYREVDTEGEQPRQGLCGVNSITFTINGKKQTVDASPETPLLWLIRDTLGLTGTKFGCGISQCGACTVHLDGLAIRSCVTPVSQAVGKNVTTIEGLSSDNSHPLQRAWITEDVPQCGYCQAGMIMSAAALLVENKSPSDADIDEALSGNICRCGTYQRIRRAIHRAARERS